MHEQEMQHGQQQVEQSSSRPQRLRRLPDRYTPPSPVSDSLQDPANHDGVGSTSDYSAADQEFGSSDTGSAEQQQRRPQKRHRGFRDGHDRPVDAQYSKRRKYATPIVTMADGSKHVQMVGDFC